MTETHTGVSRPPLDVATLRQRLIRPGGLWRDIQAVEETGSTNADLLAAARAGAPEGTVLAAETQTAGRGRLGRTWVSPPRAALACSVLLRPAGVRPARRSWLPLLTGVAVAAALRDEAGVPACLKWPNDVLVGDRKIAGILAEAHGGAVVIGLGINVTLTRAELPVPSATSLLLEGAAGLDRAGLDRAGLDRAGLLAAVLDRLARGYAAWAAGADAARLRQDYLAWCATIGQPVRVELPGGGQLTGVAEDVDAAGRLAVRTGAGRELVGAGDVLHLRLPPAGGWLGGNDREAGIRLVGQAQQRLEHVWIAVGGDAAQ